MAFHSNGETVWVANHNAGTISVVSINPFQELHRFSAGKGVATLEFYDREAFSTALGPHHPGESRVVKILSRRSDTAKKGIPGRTQVRI